MAVTHLCAPDALDGGSVEIAGKAYRHLFRARRLGRDQTIRLVDGLGRARWATVASVDRRRAVLVVGDEAPTGEPDREVTLFVAPPRMERTTWLVEKATEIGVVSIRFLITERAARDFGQGRIERLRRVAAAAVEQCHRARAPAIYPPAPLAEAIGSAEHSAPLFLLDTQAAASLRPDASASACSILAGPEGGWTDAERRWLVENGATPVRLGRRILRVETAAVTAAAIALLV